MNKIKEMRASKPWKLAHWIREANKNLEKYPEIRTNLIAQVLKLKMLRLNMYPIGKIVAELNQEAGHKTSTHILANIVKEAVDGQADEATSAISNKLQELALEEATNQVKKEK